MSLRFVLLRHETPASFARSSHWDFLLEREQACWTWALEQLPLGLAEQHDCQPSQGEVPAIRLPDHRKHYLQYEGPIAGDRGTVSQVATGQYDLHQLTDERIVAVLRPTSNEYTMVLDLIHDDKWHARIVPNLM